MGQLPKALVLTEDQGLVLRKIKEKELLNALKNTFEYP